MMSKMNRREFFRTAAAGTLLYTFARGSLAAQPVKIAVPVTAGGSMDIVARLVGRYLSAYLNNTSVVVENRPGGSTMIATQDVAHAPADGTSILMVSNTFTINPSLRKHLPYDTDKDFYPLSQSTIIPHLLVVHPSVQAKTLGELLALAHENPGKLSYASYGNGSSNHLNMEVLKKRLDLDITHIPYKGGSDAAADLLSGRVQMTLANLPELMPALRDGKLRGIALAHPQRLASLPEYPTFAEEGVPNFASNSWFGFACVSGVDPAAKKQLSEGLQAVIALPEVRAKLAALHIEPVGSSPEDFAKFIESEKAAYAEAVKIAGVEMQG